MFGCWLVGFLHVSTGCILCRIGFYLIVLGGLCLFLLVIICVLFPVIILLYNILDIFRWYFSYYYYYYYSFCTCSYTGVWVTASLLKSPGLFSGFWPISIMLSFGWSPLVRQLPSPPVPLVTAPKAQIIIVTCIFHSSFQFPSLVEVLILLFTFFKFYSVVTWDSKVDNFACSLFFVDYYYVWSSGRD